VDFYAGTNQRKDHGETKLVIDKKIRPLPKRLSKFQRIVLANYPNARCGTADAVKETMKTFWDRKSGNELFDNFGKTAKWAIYTEPESDRVAILSNVIGVSDGSQAKAWEDACNVIGSFMMWKLEK
jgi:hypothetical protein